MLKGKDGVVYVGSPKERLGGVQSWTADQAVDVVTGWGMGDSDEDAFATVGRYTGSVELYADPASAADDIDTGDTIQLELYPGGETTGSGYLSGAVLVTGVSTSGAKDGIVGQTINWRSTKTGMTKGTTA